jgi:rhamnose transport system ATP-binding protein
LSKVTKESLIKEMVGREINEFYSTRKGKKLGKRALSVKKLSKELIFDGIEFELHQGEILGFAGLVGSRRTDVGLALFGINPVDSGTIEIDKKPVIIDSPQQAQKLGVAYLSEDRRQLGLAMPMAITTNITLPSLKKYLGKLGIINRSEENKSAYEFKNRLQIKTPSLLHEVGKLSGGNQQKVMLSKWLNTHPKIFILDEPTRGIDVGTKVEVHTIIKKLADEGMAIIFISSDLPEVIAMSDRILVMREGRQMGIVESNNSTQETIMSLAMGENIGDS